MPPEVLHLPRRTVGNKVRVISFFTGAGGLDIGFDLAGFDVVYATDIDHICCETLKANLGGVLSASTAIQQADIRTLDPTTLPKGIDLIIGGPPCQSFSASGRRAGGAAGRLDKRGTLFEAYCRIIAHVRPKAFLFENVRGILGTNKGRDWDAIVTAFRDIGYQISYRILDALDYGAPQQRERMILVGHNLSGDFLFPRPLFGPDSARKLPHRTAGEALKGIKGDKEDKEELVLSDGKYAHLLAEVPPGTNYLFFTAKRGYPKPVFAYRSRFSDFLYKADPNTAVKTLIASPGKYTGPFHWENRSFTIREYMRLQGFPDDYVFVGTRSDRVKQIGNSVSPPLGYYMAIAIAKQIFGRRCSIDLLEPGAILSFDQRKGKKALLTKQMHAKVASSSTTKRKKAVFTLRGYESRIAPSVATQVAPNVRVSAKGDRASLIVRSDGSRKLFAKMRLTLNPSVTNSASVKPDAYLDVTAYGTAEHTVQSMWNAVDDWVIRSSTFHSLFELYGHFTEPHPAFSITAFEAFTDDPIAAFAKHVSDFSNCSRYFPREHLTSLFGKRFRTSDFLDLVKKLRGYRFDIRCHETNVAIPQDVYMVSYPFTLPHRKQMNFGVRGEASARSAGARRVGRRQAK
jgi:DNA (cytosine-5)-methyltransferase 1